MGFEFTIDIPVRMPMGFAFLIANVKKWENISTGNHFREKLQEQKL